MQTSSVTTGDLFCNLQLETSLRCMLQEERLPRVTALLINCAHTANVFRLGIKRLTYRCKQMVKKGDEKTTIDVDYVKFCRKRRMRWSEI